MDEMKIFENKFLWMGFKENILKVHLGVLSFTPPKILMFFLMLYGNALVELRT